MQISALWQKNGLFSQMPFKNGRNVLRQLFIEGGGNSRPHFGGGSLCEGDHEKVGDFIHVFGVGELFMTLSTRVAVLPEPAAADTSSEPFPSMAFLLIFGCFKLTAHRARLPVK